MEQSFERFGASLAKIEFPFPCTEIAFIALSSAFSSKQRYSKVLF